MEVHLLGIPFLLFGDSRRLVLKLEILKLACLFEGIPKIGGYPVGPPLKPQQGGTFKKDTHN